MGKFQLHARRFEGPLTAPTVDEVRTRESDDRAELDRFGDELARQGYAVWIFEQDPRRATSLDPQGFVVVSEWNKHGRRLR